MSIEKYTAQKRKLPAKVARNNDIHDLCERLYNKLKIDNKVN